MSRHYTRACKGKVRHRNKHCADLALAAVNHAGMTAYKCPHCYGYHLGHDPTRAADRITQLLEGARHG